LGKTWVGRSVALAVTFLDRWVRVDRLTLRRGGEVLDAAAAKPEVPDVSCSSAVRVAHRDTGGKLGSMSSSCIA